MARSDRVQGCEGTGEADVSSVAILGVECAMSAA